MENIDKSTSEYISGSKDMEISLSDYDIVQSGCLIIPSGQKALFAFGGLKFVFDAITEEGDKEGVKFRMDKNDEFGEHVHICFVNQKAGMSGGVTKPLPVATVNNRKLSITFSNNIMAAEAENINILLYYTWLLEKSR